MNFLGSNISLPFYRVWIQFFLIQSFRIKWWIFMWFQSARHQEHYAIRCSVIWILINPIVVFLIFLIIAKWIKVISFCETDFNSLVFWIDLNQNVKLLPKVPKCQISYGNFTNSHFIFDSQGFQSSSRVLEMLKRHCLTMSKFIFHIEPLLLHFEVKFDSFDLINAANW